MDETTYKIDQKRFLCGRQTLTLEGDTLKAEYRRGLSLHEYRFDLRGLLPDPIRIKQVPTAKIVVLTLFVVLTLALVFFGTSGDPRHWTDALVVLAIVGLVLLLLAVLRWIPTVKEFVNIVVFEGPSGQVVLWSDLPNKEQFDRFLAVLTARIRSARSYEQIVLRRLRQAEIIDDWQYDQAVELFRQDGDPSDN